MEEKIELRDIPNDPINEDKLPMGESRSGSNGYYFWCDQYSGRSNYAVCLHTIEAVLEKRPNLRTSCQDAICSRTCPAIKMRKEEMQVGHALYFRDRHKTLAEFQKQSEAARAGIGYRRGNSQRGFVPTDTNTIADADPIKVKRERAEPVTAPVKRNGHIDTDLASQNIIQGAINQALEELGNEHDAQY
ncbi:hypothetical protein [Dyella telluris]|uniref:Uncharacterized protein n=1 Tax=Dyella telluris TaxID=2763498 RepID=A0A7G8Q4D6_9GAMM|nr:hypothetical protein [Dyella telluris]QNK01644.1 hypothetical protein H8F01_00240 [Dyella telluris]